MSRKLIRVFSSALMVLFDHIFHFSKRLPICSNTQYWLAIDHPSDIPIYTKGEWKVPPRKKKLHKNKSPFGNITWSFWWMDQKCNFWTQSLLNRCWWRMLKTSLRCWWRFWSFCHQNFRFCSQNIEIVTENFRFLWFFSSSLEFLEFSIVSESLFYKISPKWLIFS